MNAARLLEDIRNVGGYVALTGDDLKLRLPKSAPRDLIDAVRAAKPELIALLRQQRPDTKDDLEERAALVEYGAGVPREWAEGFARLDCTHPPADFPLHRWRQIIDDGGLFLDQWANKAAALGWTVVDVFGLNPANPSVRYDGMGLVPLIKGQRIIAISADSARLRMRTGHIQTYARRPSPSSTVLWKLQR